MTPILDVLAQATERQRNIEEALGVVQTIIQYAGTIAFAVSAALLAGRRRMTVAGVIVFGVIVATGGGTLRDVLLGNLPVYWVDEPLPLLIAAVSAGLTMPLFKLGTISVIQRYDLVRAFDAAGLALFTVTGTNIALDTGAGAVSAVVVGVIAGVGGGIIRDTIAERTPVVLASGHLYASVAVVGAGLNVALLETELPESFASAIAVAFILGLRLLAIRFGWAMPRFRVRRGEDRADSGGQDPGG